MLSDYETGMSVNHDLLIDVLKFHPLCYVHLFVLGCACAFLFRYYKLEITARYQIKKSDNSGGASDSTATEASSSSVLGSSRVFHSLIEYGASIGYAGIFLVLSFSALHPTEGRSAAG